MGISLDRMFRDERLGKEHKLLLSCINLFQNQSCFKTTLFMYFVPKRLLILLDK